MPWKETCAMDERLAFIAMCEMGQWTMSECCARFGISRPVGYKWLHRYERWGQVGLNERSRAPFTHPNALAEQIAARLIEAKRMHRSWGPKKLVAWLRAREPDESWPAPSTAGEWLKRQGLVRTRRHRRHTPAADQPLARIEAPNTVWSVDFKGQFKTGDGRWCYPLTVCDGFSRYLLGCRALLRPQAVQVRPWLERIFREYGLPARLRSDNGPPFASTGLGGLSRLAVWWVRLGIVPERIMPGHPEQNGRLERLHRTLKAACASPPRASVTAQQRACERFRREYNDERPHEALGYRVPASVYRPAWRAYPRRLPCVQYPAHWPVRRVRQAGEMRWGGELVFVSEALAGEPVGFEPLTEQYYRLYFGPVLLGIFDAHTRCIRRPHQRTWPPCNVHNV